jgi:4-carboxymuconolactone decarboxylase
MPDTFNQFKAQFPQAWAAYEDLKNVCDKQGPLDRKTVELIKIGISATLGREGGLVAHISKAQKAGAHKNEIYHTILVTSSLAGFPAALAAFSVARKHLERT